MERFEEGVEGWIVIILCAIHGHAAGGRCLPLLAQGCQGVREDRATEALLARQRSRPVNPPWQG